MNPLAEPRDAVRAAYLPLDCPRPVLRTVFQREPEMMLSDADGFQQYVRAAIDHVNIEPCAATGIEGVREFVTFAAIAPLRIRRANPLVGTEYEAREPRGSAERRMLQHPLRKHPGLTWFERNAREYYIATLTHFFEHELPESLQSEIAAILFAPDPEDPTTRTAYQTYAGIDPETIHRRYVDRIDVSADGDIHINVDHLSRCCQLLPKSASQVDFAYSERVEYLKFEGGDLVIPNQQFRLHLAEYAWHAWGKLVNIAFNTLTPHDVDRLVAATPHIETDLLERFRRNNKIYTPYYGTSGTKNPRRDWALQTDPALTERPLQLEDKRLITIADCIRANTDLSFGQPIPINTLFDRIQGLFPASHRPGNDIGTKDTLRNAVQAAASDQFEVTSHPDTNELACIVPPPTPTPYHPETAATPWDCYRATLAKRSHAEPERQRQTDDGYPCLRIHPILPRELTPKHASAYETHLARTQQTAVTDQRTVAATHDVEPLVDPESLPQLTRDEIVFLTRISLAMERVLDGASLTRSMRPLRYDDTGTELQVTESKLHQLGWLERHEEGPSVLYTVPFDKRRKLGVENISHDGYGEKTPKEKSLHRKGVDRCATAFAAKQDVTRVVRYCDLWRLRNTPCEPALAEHDLFSTRIDVIAFNGTTPKYAAGIETQSGSASKSRRCVQKLAALSETLETWLITPNSDHLWTVMRHVNDSDHLDFNTFPKSNPDSYGRSNWERELIVEGFLGEYFDQLHTYGSLDDAKIDPKTDDRQHKIIGHV